MQASRSVVQYALPNRLNAATVAEVRYGIEIALDSAPGDLLVDCSALEVLDSAGLALLVGMHRRCHALGRRLVLADPRPNVMRVLAVTRLHRVMHLERPRSTA